MSDYRNGWRASERAGSDAGGLTPLDRADARNVSDEWYDGYYDNAAGRAYGHSLRCPRRDHDACEVD